MIQAGSVSSGKSDPFSSGWGLGFKVQDLQAKALENKLESVVL